MWPQSVDWKTLTFGVEIEFIGGQPEQLELLPGWIMSLEERQLDETGLESGSELKPPPLLWEDRAQIRTMLERLQAQGASVNWSCGLHVHIGLEPWGQGIVPRLLDAALQCQEAIEELLGTSPHRRLFCPPVTAEMKERYAAAPEEDSVRNFGRPQSHRCGINTAAWFDIQTVEIRYANGSLNYEEILATVELCLRFVAAVGEGSTLSSDFKELAVQLSVPIAGYPPPLPPPRWFEERTWLEDSLTPVLTSMAADLVQHGEIHHILPVPEGLLLAVEDRDGHLSKFVIQPPAAEWKVVRQITE
ncbi:amidoligase family protein [Paenibacillus sp. 1011MAR3C5]|uniref:amidoligase family protein n=1 Tax=Paenibacillus sp. 1011MAR3C5 TaxID=1675787 RepID=UPI0016028E5A|nr:amidoligase family protein [Paenibacillus sp. 1011MAR3C5]